MNQNTRHLVRLQELNLESREIERLRGDLPKRLLALEQEFAARLEEIGGARLRHEELVRQRDELTRELESTGERLANAQKKLMHVSNQREYSAALNEIDTMKTHTGSLEQQILEREEEIETLAGPAAEADERIASERADLDAQKQSLKEEAEGLLSRLEEIGSERDRLLGELPAAHRRQFENLARLRDGVAMAAIENGACSACHVRLRPQVISLVRRGEDLITCESCARILYIAEMPADSAATDAGSGASPSAASS